MCVLRRVHICDSFIYVTHSYMCHHPRVRVLWFVDAFISEPWLTAMSAMTHSCLCHDSLMGVPWLIHVWVPWLIQTTNICMHRAPRTSVRYIRICICVYVYTYIRLIRMRHAPRTSVQTYIRICKTHMYIRIYVYAAYMYVTCTTNISQDAKKWFTIHNRLIYIHMDVFTCMYICNCMYIYIHVYIMHVYIHTYVNMHGYIDIYIYIYIYMNMFMYM